MCWPGKGHNIKVKQIKLPNTIIPYVFKNTFFIINLFNLYSFLYYLNFSMYNILPLQ